jgi:hypothetical protein
MPAPQQTAPRRDWTRRLLTVTGTRHITAPAPAPEAPSGSRLTGGSVIGNERLTAAGGVILIALLAALGVTILRIRLLIDPHLFIGLLLLPPVVLKLASTGYRFARYYTNDAVYRARGAPALAMRLLGPLVVLTTAAVFATGVLLLAEGPGASGTLRTLHKASFILWIGATALHVLGHLPDLARILLRRSGGPAGDGRYAYGRGRYEYNRLAAGGIGRTLALGGAIVAGAVLAVLLIPHFAGWSHFESIRHLDH